MYRLGLCILPKNKFYNLTIIIMTEFNYEKYKPWTKFWMLTILEVLNEKKNWYRLLRCKCECWKETFIRTQVWGKDGSCWCRRWTVHWMSNTPEYYSWAAIIARCNRKSYQYFKNYGGRWIKCEWKTFEEFYKDMWKRPWPWYTIDRIDVNWNYCKENCRWATNKQQNNNRTNNVKCVINWEGHTLQERADKLWISRHVLKRGILKWRIEWVLFNYKHSWKWY